MEEKQEGYVFFIVQFSFDSFCFTPKYWHVGIGLMFGR